MRYNLRQIECFAALAETRHFGNAANKLNMTQPAFSRQIMGLENAIGFKVVDRTSNRVALTNAGHSFLEGSTKALKILEKSERTAKLVANGLTESLRLGHTDLAMFAELPRILNRFQEKFPKVFVESFQGFTDDIIQKIKADELDFGIVTGPIKINELESRVAFTHGFIVAVWKGHPFERKKNITLRDIAQEKLIFGSAQHRNAFMFHVNEILRKSPIKPNIFEGAFKIDGVLGLVAEKMGITIYADCIQNFHRRDVIFRPVSDVNYRLPTLAVWRKGNTSPNVGSFIKCMGLKN